MQRYFIGYLAIILFSFHLFTGCSSTEVNEGDPKAVYEDAEDDVKNDRYQLAIDKLRKVKSKFPYSSYSVLAQLKIADVYFLQESFSEAALSYETFEELHPNHPQAPYAAWKIGESHFMAHPTNIARDQTSAAEALEAFERFVRKYPKHERTPEAQKRIDEILDILAEKELYIGNFYFKRDYFESSYGRYQTILSNYKTSSSSGSAQKSMDDVKEHVEKNRNDPPKTENGTPKYFIYK